MIVVSALSRRAADVTMQCLGRAAMDYVAKPAGAAELASVFRAELPQKIRNMAGTDVAACYSIASRVLRGRRPSSRPPRPMVLCWHTPPGMHCHRRLDGRTAGAGGAVQCVVSAAAPDPGRAAHASTIYRPVFGTPELALHAGRERRQTGDKLRPNLALVCRAAGI